MKNVLLMIVLGLFAVGCFEEGDGNYGFSPEYSDTEWLCESNGGATHSQWSCENQCEEDCYECEWMETNWGSICE